MGRAFGSGGEDRTKDTSTNWDREIASGNLVQKQPTQSNVRRSGQHINGIPLTQREATARTMTRDGFKHLMETGRRRPETREAGSARRPMVHGFRRADGSVPGFLDHAPFKGPRS